MNRKELFHPARLALAGIVLLVAAVALLITRSSNDFLEVPDVAHPLEGVVKVPAARPDKDAGGIYYVDVVIRRASFLESRFSWLRPDGSSLVDPEELAGPGISESQRQKYELADMKLSQAVASTVALRALGYRVPAKYVGLRVVAITVGSRAHGVLREGDVIVSADGTRVVDREGLRAVLAEHQVGDVVRLGVRRRGKVRVLAVRTTSERTAPGRPILGIIPISALDARLPFKIGFQLAGVGGPSAGLAFALELLEQRGRDVDHGYKVAATGKIELDGSVTGIGGVPQKTIGARRAHADVFLVPVAGDNAKQARRYAHGLKIIPVKNFQQALHALATLPPKS